MKIEADVKLVEYDNFEVIKNQIDKKEPFQLMSFDDNENEDMISIWLEAKNRDIGSTIFIDMDKEQAMFFAKGLLLIIEARELRKTTP